ncbi:MAG: hypothetical protein ACYDH9_24715 [Limisphaerales bacterium]
MLVILSLTSLSILLLHVATPGIGGAAPANVLRSGGSLTDLYALFSSGAFQRTDYGRDFLLVALSVIAARSLLSFRSARQSEEPK